LIVPVVLAVSVVGTIAAAVSTASGCHSSKPTIDAGRDGPADVPVV
jgi:hypothetical protein